jgi:hypothetical protein
MVMLKAVLDSLEGLSEDVASHYIEKDGKFILGVETTGGLALENVEGLKSALGKEKASRKELAASLKAFEGLDADKARDALSKLDELAESDPEGKAKQQIEAFKAQLVAKHEATVAEKDKALGDVTSQLERLLVENAVRSALEKAEANVDLMLPHVMQRTRMRRDESTGRYVAEVLDDNGNPAIGDAAGNVMTIPQLVGEFKSKDTYAAGFKGTGSSGSGADAKGRAPGTVGRGHRISVADSKDVHKYRAAKAAAEKAGIPLEIVE